MKYWSPGMNSMSMDRWLVWTSFPYLWLNRLAIQNGFCFLICNLMFKFLDFSAAAIPHLNLVWTQNCLFTHHWKIVFVCWQCDYFPLELGITSNFVLHSRLGIQIAGMLIQEHPHTLIFFTSLLVDYPDLPPPLDSQPPLVVPWSKWGDRTRMTVWQPLPWEICAHGTRLVKRVPSKAINRWQIQLCDFNPYVQHLNESPSSPKSKASSRLVGSDEENVISNPLLFRYPILSSLPYLEITTNTLFPSLDSVMLDHENIYIVVSEPPFIFKILLTIA